MVVIAVIVVAVVVEDACACEARVCPSVRPFVFFLVNDVDAED